jgi:hypothetical protein
MSLRFVRIALVAGVVLIPTGIRSATTGQVPAPATPSCSTAARRVCSDQDPARGGAWSSTVSPAAGFDQESEQIAYLNSIFGTNFASLADLQVFNIQQVSEAWDENRNGLVCAFQLRGTKAYLGDPFVNLTYFGISDDRIGKD